MQWDKDEFDNHGNDDLLTQNRNPDWGSEKSVDQNSANIGHNNASKLIAVIAILFIVVMMMLIVVLMFL